MSVTAKRGLLAKIREQGGLSSILPTISRRRNPHRFPKIGQTRGFIYFLGKFYGEILGEINGMIQWNTVGKLGKIHTNHLNRWEFFLSLGA